MAEINWTAEAERWMRDIYDYIAQDKPVAATNVVSGIYAKAQLLKDFPEIGYMYRKEPDGDIRHFAVWPLSNRVFDKKPGEYRYFGCLSRCP
jgi:plasmid stabilization system protein ParE